MRKFCLAFVALILLMVSPALAGITIVYNLIEERGVVYINNSENDLQDAFFIVFTPIKQVVIYTANGRQTMTLQQFEAIRENSLKNSDSILGIIISPGELKKLVEATQEK